MKRVCHLTSVHSSDDTRVFHKECVSLARAGYDVTLVAPGESREEQGVHIVGVGEKPKDWDLADYVLGRFDKEDRALVENAIGDAIAAAELMVQGDVDKAMNDYNSKKTGK